MSSDARESAASWRIPRGPNTVGHHLVDDDGLRASVHGDTRTNIVGFRRETCSPRVAEPVASAHAAGSAASTVAVWLAAAAADTWPVDCNRKPCRSS